MRIYWASYSQWMRAVPGVGGLAIGGNQADLYLPSWTFIASLDGKLLPLFSIDCCLAKRWIFGVQAAVLCLWIIGWVAGNWNEKGYDIDG